VGDLAPGDHKAAIKFRVPNAEPLTVQISAQVFPVRFPDQPYMVFDVNNVVNYLCARQPKRNQWVWAPEKAEAYLSDMQTHGVRGQTMIGTNAPSSHYWYDRVKLRETGEVLPEAIKKEPLRFRNRLDLPALDFSEWEWMIEQLIRHGQTELKWPMGGCQHFMSRHSRLTQLVYGRTLPDGDLRDMAVKEWYFRELSRWLRDRGVPRLLVSIDDEIPSEKLAWWTQHAYRSLQMNLEPGVTQSAKTLASDTLINIVAPFMKYWIVGTLHKATIDLRRQQGIIRPEHWVTTYHSSANHWRPYDQTRGHCGLNPAFFDLDACWIQVYWRWRQSEAIVYPTEEGPVSSAAWEGCRDGLDDGNFLLLARAMAAGLGGEALQAECRARIDAIVGMREDSLIRFVDRETSVGTVSTMGDFKGRFFRAGYDTDRFREAKRRLLNLIVELAGKVSVQKAAADFGLHPLIRDGRCVYRIPKGMKRTEEAVAFLKAAAGPLAFEKPEPADVVSLEPYPVFFFGTLEELKSLLPALGMRTELADLSERYPAKGQYVIRFVRRSPNPRLKEKLEDMPESLLILVADDAGAGKALELLPKVIRQPKFLYSHWLPEHQVQ